MMVGQAFMSMVFLYKGDEWQLGSQRRGGSGGTKALVEQDFVRYDQLRSF
jgi:hypothetical protein